MKGQRSLFPKMRKKSKAILASCISVVLVFTGIPFIPGFDIDKAYASTSVNLSTNGHIAPVYGEGLNVTFSYNDPGKNEDGTEQTEHTTNIEISGTQSATLVSGQSYPVKTNNEFFWDGLIDSKPAKDGSYTLSVLPSEFPQFGGSSQFTVNNPIPPAPKFEIIPDKNSETHVIRGIGEVGTNVQLYLATKKKTGSDLTAPGKKDGIIATIPITKAGRTWSSLIPTEGYFPNFPNKSSKKSEDFIGEWSYTIQLPEYEIASIYAKVEREFDKKTSPSSEILQVLRYKAPTYDVKWAVIAAYYYKAETVPEMAQAIRSVAGFNGYTLDYCSDGQICPGNIDKGVNLLFLNPLAAGNITPEDTTNVEKAFYNRNGYPIPAELDPVNLATGHFLFQHTNLSLQAAMPLEFGIVYHSNDPYNGTLGVGWHHSLDWHLEKWEQGKMVSVSPEGARYIFSPLSNGGYLTPAGSFDSLRRRADGTFELTRPDQSVYSFRQDGMLSEIKDANGNRTTYTYHETLLQKVETAGASLSLSYGEAGKLVKLTDHTGRSVDYQYDRITHDLKKVILPDGAAIGFDYDSQHRITGITNPNGTGNLVNVYDEQGRVIKQKDYADKWSFVSYDADNRKTTTKDALGRETVYTFDDRYRQTRIDYPDGTSEQFDYDNNDNMIGRTDRNGNSTEYVYDERGNLLQVIDPYGSITSLQYNEFGKVKEMVDALGKKTEVSYDSKGNAVGVKDALGRTSVIERDAKGVPTAVVKSGGERTTLENDTHGFVYAITDPAGFRKELVRDGLHRVTDIIDPLGNRTKMEYDARDRAVGRIDALQQKESYTYDKDSNLTGYTDVMGETTTYLYDTFDRVRAVTDALQHTTEFEYDAVGNLIKQIDPTGAITEYGYNSVNRVEWVKNAKGQKTTFTYDGNGNVTSKTDPNGARTEVVYDKRNLPVSVKDPVGAITTYTYDALGRLTAQNDALGAQTRYEYDEAGNITKMTDALQQVTVYDYDEAGRLATLTKPNGAVWRMEYDKRGLLTATVDPMGGRREVQRDELGRIKSERDEAGTPTNYTYDPLGRVRSMMDALGYVTEFEYDGSGRVTAVKDAKQQVTRYSYDKLGHLTGVTDALNQITSYSYNEAGSLLSKTDARGHTTAYEYDLLEEAIRQIDPLGRLSEWEYDSIGSVIRAVQPDGTATEYGYDAAGRMTDILYADGNRVGYAYDLIGRRTSMTDSTGTTSYDYDALNRLTGVTDGRNQTIRYEWTSTNQRSKVVYPDGSIVGYEYDLMDRMTAVTDSSGGRTAYNYDARGLLTKKTLPNHAVSSYRYDLLGQVLEMSQSSQGGKLLEKLNYVYDPVGNRTRMERIEGGDDEDRTDETAQNGVVSDYTYDALNRLVSVQKQNGADASSLLTTNYVYDAVGNRLNKTTNWAGIAKMEAYTYNAADQLTRWESGADYKDYKYDLRGNLLQVFGLEGTEDALGLDETLEGLLADGDSSVSLDVYQNLMPEDPSANVVPSVYESESSELMSEPVLPAIPQVLEQYNWDGANRLVQHINPFGDRTGYSYDGDGNRVGMTIDYAHGPEGRNKDKGNGKHGTGNQNIPQAGKCDKVVPPGFVPPGLAKKCGAGEDELLDHPGGPRDGWEHEYKKKHWEFHYTNDVSLELPEPLQVTEADASKWKETYAYGLGQERLSMTYLPAYDANNGWEPAPGEGGAEPGTTPKTLYYLNDALGNVLGVMGQDGRVSARYHYDEFGVPLDDKKFDVNWPGPDNLFGYTGLGYDYSSGLSYARARYYSPGIGRFVSEDTYEGDIKNPLTLNLYTYVHNNPLRYTDPSGHMVKDFLNIFLLKYIKENDTSRMVNAVIGSNGNSDSGRYIAFHEIAQIMAGKQIHEYFGVNTTLEFHLEEEIKWWPNKHYWADIVTGDNQVWEVKPRRQTPLGGIDGYYEDAEAQLTKYQSINGNLTRGQQLEGINGIEILKAGRGKYTEYLKMNIEYYDKGKILYDFYIEDANGKFLYALTTSQAEDYVEANYDYPINPLDFIKWPKGKK